MSTYGFPQHVFDVYVRDRCTCQYCGYSGIGDFDAWMHLSIDHLVPKMHGGSEDDPDNLVTCCNRCNVLLGSANPPSGTRDQQIEWKRQEVAKKRAGELPGFLGMMDAMFS